MRRKTEKGREGESMREGERERQRDDEIEKKYRSREIPSPMSVSSVGGCRNKQSTIKGNNSVQRKRKSE